jgi:cytochrome P450
MLRATLGRYLKEGLINAEGDRHRIVRRIVGGLFGKGNVRGMMPVFTMKCGQLRGMWSERVNTLISDFHSQTILSSPEAIRQEETETGVLMDVLDGLNRLSFDIIGLTAFDHSFDALRGMKGKGFVVPWPGSEGEEKQHPAAATREQVKPAQSIEEDHGEGSRIYEAYDRMFDVCEGRTGLRGMLSVMWPALDKIWVSRPSQAHAPSRGLK